MKKQSLVVLLEWLFQKIALAVLLFANRQARFETVQFSTDAELSSYISQRFQSEPVVLFFTAERDKLTGTRWCPDSQQVESTVRESILPSVDVAVIVATAKQNWMENQQYHEPPFLLWDLPSLVIWENHKPVHVYQRRDATRFFAHILQTNPM